MAASAVAMDADRSGGANIYQVIGAAGVGTMIEWYDFYIFGSLATTIIAPKFFPQGNETLAVLSALATFAAGFAARPFGALFFGRIGDIVGRKYAFLVTLLIMGGATTLIGILPGYRLPADQPSPRLRRSAEALRAKAEGRSRVCACRG